MPVPWEKEEYLDAERWAAKARRGELAVIPCISGWMDICGFGAALEAAGWDLKKLQERGLLELLSHVYQRVGHPLLVGVEPMPFETVLVINDGIARPVDLNRPEHADGAQFVFYLRDLFFAHKFLVEKLKAAGYGIRTILAGGERVQYSPSLFTGNSLLQHDEENISNFGKKLLGKNFLHNPAEFQINTAFAKSYSIDSLGTRSGVNVNCCYVEDSFWNPIQQIPSLAVVEQPRSWLVLFNGSPALEVSFSERLNLSFKGLDVCVRQINWIRIDASFEGEETLCDIAG